MTGLTIGSLCSGYGGLDLAVESFFDAETRWFCEFEAAPSKVLAARWPGVPNFGDMTKVDWASVEPVDIIAGGTPCQDLSAAGRRKGMTEGTRSNLWVQMREAAAVIRPRYVIWENVRGAFSAYAASEVEFEQGLLGEYGPNRPALRALGRVLGDLSDLGYDSKWVGVRASDVGAPHNRFRVFVLAERRFVEDAGYGRGRSAESESPDRDHATVGPDLRRTGARQLVANSDRGRRGQRHEEQRIVSITDAPHPDAIANSAGRGRDGRAQEALGEPIERVASAWSGGDAIAHADGATLREYAGGPFAEETRSPGGDRSRNPDGERAAVEWGPYEPAIRRWEQALGRLAPAPTEASLKGAQRLSPRFVEWMMGLPEGWVTDLGLKRTEQLKALGNGVVPQQALYALELMEAA